MRCCCRHRNCSVPFVTQTINLKEFSRTSLDSSRRPWPLRWKYCFIDLLVLTSRSYIIPVSRLLGMKKRRRRRTRDDERNIAIRKAQLHAIVDGERTRDGLGSCGKISASQLQVLSLSFSSYAAFYLSRSIFRRLSVCCSV